MCGDYEGWTPASGAMGLAAPGHRVGRSPRFGGKIGGAPVMRMYFPALLRPASGGTRGHSVPEDL